MDIQTSFSAEIKKQERETWRMDSERSHAYFTIYPVRDGDESYYHFTWGLELKPYPNPFSYGGCWCNGGARNKEDLEKYIDEFNREVDRWRKYGLTRVEMKEEPERDMAVQRKRNEALLAKSKPAQYKKQAQLSLM